uniref:F-box family protein n=1 Tax=Pithovirus LCPAC406 TaxID=2506599 RepID=A0A481ZHK3_9VIRU|nr:MAG: F-box family protein [Pithovirus LCPAC406]
MISVLNINTTVKMASVNEILIRLNLSKRDLNNVSLSQLRTIFQDLTVKEISKLCVISKRFNSICKDESFWRNKVSDDYGIHKKYGNTWRQTAIVMNKVDMINLNNVWIGGRTYKEILDDTLLNGAHFILDLQNSYLLPLANNSANDTNELQYHTRNDDTELQDFANEVLHRDYTDDELNDIYYIRNREINVIYATVLTYKGEGLYLPGDTIENTTTGTALPSYEFIREMIDPMFYMMQFSSFSIDRLAEVSY